MPIYNGYPQAYYPQQPQGQLEQLRAAQYQPQPVMMPTMQAQISGQTRTETPTGNMITAVIRDTRIMAMLTTAMWTIRRTQVGRGQDN